MLDSSRGHERAPSTLYVTNLSASATSASLRERFATVGEVVKVELAAPGAGRSPTSAYVTMASSADADAAVRKLHGRLFHDRSMMVTVAPMPEAPRKEPRGAVASGARVTISQQYRERLGMVFELDCAGVPLTLRFFFADDGHSERRVEARVVTPLAELVAEGSGATREAALTAVAEAWRGLDSPPELDWAEITPVLRVVRAL